MIHRKNIKYLIIGLLILLLGFILRIYNLSTNPPELYTDELANIESAKSVIETGHDLAGKQGIYFGDRVEMRPPVYGYSAYLSSLVFGDNSFGERFPAVIYGLITIILIGLYVSLITSNKAIGLLAASIMAILPWDIHYSRVGWEPAALLPFILGGLYLLTLAIKTNRKWLIILGCTLLGLANFTYHTAVTYSLILLTGLIVFNYKFFWQNKLMTILGLIIYGLIILQLPLAAMNNPGSMDRAIRISTFTPGINQQSVSIFIRNYLSHFDINFLFIHGDSNLRHSGNVGELYWWMLPFIFIGLYLVMKHLKQKPMDRFFLLWLLIYPLAGSLTNDGFPHATRTLVGAPIWVIITSFGIFTAYQYLHQQSNKISLTLAIILSLVVVGFLANFCYEYYVIYPKISAPAWQYGHAQVFKAVTKLEDNYLQVCLGNLDYWGNKPLLAHYMKESKLRVIETDQDPRCSQSKTIVVSPVNDLVASHGRLRAKVFAIDGKTPIYEIFTTN